jgi:hypothetical protein
MNKHLSLTLQNTLASVVTPFIAVACCGLSDFTPDANLVVEIEAPAEQSLEPGASGDDVAATEALCGARVVAIDDDGNEIPLTEENVDGRCRYRGQVDGDESYTVKATHPDLPELVAEGPAQSNPACNQATAAEDTDSTLVLSEATPPEDADDADDADDDADGQSG